MVFAYIDNEPWSPAFHHHPWTSIGAVELESIVALQMESNIGNGSGPGSNTDGGHSRSHTIDTIHSGSIITDKGGGRDVGGSSTTTRRARERARPSRTTGPVERSPDAFTYRVSAAAGKMPRRSARKTSIVTQHAEPEVNAAGPLRNPCTHSLVLLALVAPYQLTWRRFATSSISWSRVVRSTSRSSTPHHLFHAHALHTLPKSPKKQKYKGHWWKYRLRTSRRHRRDKTPARRRPGDSGRALDVWHSALLCVGRPGAGASAFLGLMGTPQQWCRRKTCNVGGQKR